MASRTSAKRIAKQPTPALTLKVRVMKKIAWTKLYSRLYRGPELRLVNIYIAVKVIKKKTKLKIK